MLRRLITAFAILAIACLGGCQRGRDSDEGGAYTRGGGKATLLAGGPATPDPMDLSREQLQAIEEMTAILEKIKDDATAAAVITDLRKAAARLQAINKKMMALQTESTDSEAAAAKLNDPAVQKQIEKVIDAAGRMTDANLQAQLKAPGKRREIQAACDSANVPKAPKKRK
jgi:hypothetical protein